MHKLYVIIVVFFFMQTTFGSILPENDLAIPTSVKGQGLTEDQYHATINKVEAIYRPIVEQLDKKLTIKRFWEDPKVNAGTTRKGPEILINLYGGYARHAFVSEDAYALVICHELGHHLAGTPKKVSSSGETKWPSVEGQADYFATLKCLRKVFKDDDNLGIVAKLEVPALVQEKCSLSFKDEREKALCARTALAGMATAKISADIRRRIDPSFETPDSTTVDKTYEAHPLPQCRLDTYFQGSICAVSSGESLSRTDEVQGTCHKINGHTEGLRPLCWFKPLLSKGLFEAGPH